MSVPDLATFAGLDPLEREHLSRIEDALGDLLLSSKLHARKHRLVADQIDPAVVSLLYAMAAREAFLTSREQGEAFDITACQRLAADAAIWVRDRNQKAFGLN